MINLIAILIIYGLWISTLYLNSKNDILKKENERLRDRIKRDTEWFEVDKKISCDLARVNERLKISSEEFRKQFYKKCDEIDKSLEVLKNEEGQNITR